MATTEFVKNYVDVIVVYDYNKTDYKTLLKAGYEPNEEGGIEVEMLFGDGLAYDTQMNGIVMRYPTLAEVAKSSELQRKIWLTTCRDEIIPYDVALTFGKVGRYKYVLDYNEWVKQGNNDCKEIYAIFDEWNMDSHYFDLFEDEYFEMDDKDLISHINYDALRGRPSMRRVNKLAAKYGILWTEWVGTHIVPERGIAKKVA